MISVRIFMAALLLSPLAAHADFELANAYYAQGKFKEAHDEYLLLATNGDHDAQFNLGVMYFKGQYVAADMVDAYGWVSLATQKNYPQYLNVKQLIHDELNPEQQATAAAKAEELANEFGDTAQAKKMTPRLNNSPYEDAKAITKVLPAYPKSALAMSEGGFVDLAFDIDEYGVPHEIGFSTGTNQSLAEASITALRHWRYAPAQVKGRTANLYRSTMRVNFSIADFDKNDIKKILSNLEKNTKSNTPTELYKFAYASDLFASFRGVGFRGL